MDGRCSVIRAIPEVRALDAANDVLALSQDGRDDLERAHQAHWMGDAPAFLKYLNRADGSFRAIRDVSRRWADDVMTAPQIDPTQLPLHRAA